MRPRKIGQALCPCDGTLAPERYGETVTQLIRGLDASPRVLLDPLVERMEMMSRDQRFEEAGWLRDRHDALARALESKRLWQSLVSVGMVELEDANTKRVVIDHARLVGSWPSQQMSPALLRGSR